MAEQPAEKTRTCPCWNEENPNANMLKDLLQESSPLGSGRMSLCQHGGFQPEGELSDATDPLKGTEA